MVKEWGMSEKVGLRTVDNENNALVKVNDLSPQTVELLDSEIKSILQVPQSSFFLGLKRINHFIFIGLVRPSQKYFEGTPTGTENACRSLDEVRNSRCRRCRIYSDVEKSQEPLRPDLTSAAFLRVNLHRL